MEPTETIEPLSDDLELLVPAPSTTRALGAAALVLMAANLVGSVLGFARGAVIAHVFGASIHTDAFFAASLVPQMFYDLTIGAAISAALIPTLTEILHRRGQNELAHTVGAVLGLTWLVLAVVIFGLLLLARPLMSFLLFAYPSHTAGVDDAVPIVRLILPSLFFLGTAAILLSSLYSVRRFRVSAFAASLYHLGIIGGAVALARPLGILALPVGATVGAAAQAAVQAPESFRHIGRLRPRLELTPDVRRILRLYAPVAVGLVVSVAGQIIDINFKAHLGQGPITWMVLATTLVQFPIGIAAAALAFAVLPLISADAMAGRTEEFKRTLALGMRLALFLTIPAAIGYLALANPIVALLFEHHKFTAYDSSRTATALIGYAIQIPFVGIDQLLIFAFYARKNTVTPMLIGVLGVCIYVASALLLMPRWNVLGLALANTIQNSTHGLILLFLLIAAIGTLRGTGLASGIVKTGAAAAVMTVGVVSIASLLDAHFHGRGIAVWAPEVAIPVAAGAALYLATAALLGSEELQLFWTMTRRRKPAPGSRLSDGQDSRPGGR